LRPTVERGEEAELAELTLDQAERVLIQDALRRCDGNVTEAAHSLGLSRSALYRRLKAHGL
jgi:transcriptional regulator of acetoin/glycerol metabolism